MRCAVLTCSFLWSTCAVECRAALLASVEATSDAVMADVNSRLVEALNNQKKIEQDTRQLQLQSAQLTK